MDDNMLYLDGSVIDTDEKCYAANLWCENDEIVVRWVYEENGADATSLLLDEDPKTIWDIIRSIK